MTVWTFYDYVEPSGRVPFWDWLSGLPEDAQAWIDTRILYMAALLSWSEKWISSYQGPGKLYELRIPFNRVQCRPLGMYAPGRAFVLLAGAIEKGGKLPRATVAAAVQRQQQHLREPHHVRHHRFHQG